jgi:hypothetical protein
MREGRVSPIIPHAWFFVHSPCFQFDPVAPYIPPSSKSLIPLRRKPDESAAVQNEHTLPDVFTWQHLQCEVPIEGGMKHLLDDVTGFVVPGKLTASMGKSGAGKVCSSYDASRTNDLLECL